MYKGAACGRSKGAAIQANNGVSMDETVACSGFFTAKEEGTINCLESFQQDGVLQWISGNLLEGIYNIGYAALHPQLWLNWEDKQALGRFIYYGGSHELFFAIVIFFLTIFAIGIFARNFLWGVVRGLEGFANVTGRLFAWAGLIMVLQQVMIIFLQRVFRVSEISLGPFGAAFTKDLSWWSEELKLYNAMIVALCCAYTFVQGGHVRVDLFYAGMKHRTKRFMDMFGCVFFMMPAMVLTWMYGWFFLWRNLVTPKISASDGLDMILRKAGLMKWNVETIGFSPNGFNGYFLFKILLVSFAGMMFLQACAFFYRSYLEFVEGEDSADKYLDKDVLDDEVAETAAAIH